MGIIYCISRGDKRYVGKTVQPFDVRWGGHVGSARREDNGMLICRAIRKHGPEAFDRSVVEECSDDVLGARETYWIRELKSHVSEGGYNLTYGGDGGLSGYVFSEASKEKIRQKATGRKHSEETKAKMRAAKLGKKQSVAAIAKRIAANTGKKRTEEQCVRISESLKGHVVSDETRARIGFANTQRIVTEKTKAKFYKAVDQIAADDTLIKTFKSLTDAAKVAGLSKGAMSGVVRNPDRLVNGFHWRYKSGVKNGDF